MPPVRSLVFKRRARTVAVILLLSEIMPTYSYCVSKGLVCITITALFSRQPCFYTKYIKLNMHSSCDIRLVLDTEYIFLIHFTIF